MTPTQGNTAAPDAGKVVKMNRFLNGRTLSPIRQAEAYWSALREGAGIPRRSQIDPRGLEPLLEFAFILEHVAPGSRASALPGGTWCGSAAWRCGDAAHRADLAGLARGCRRGAGTCLRDAGRGRTDADQRAAP
ncbi:PAS domain-containing protein [Seohaeicola zhoushanensis]